MWFPLPAGNLWWLCGSPIVWKVTLFLGGFSPQCWGPALRSLPIASKAVRADLLFLSVLCNAHLSWILLLMSWCFLLYIWDRSTCSPFRLNPRIFWSDTVKSWQLLVSHTVFYHPSWLQGKENYHNSGFPTLLLLLFYTVSYQSPQRDLSLQINGDCRNIQNYVFLILSLTF